MFTHVRIDTVSQIVENKETAQNRLISMSFYVTYLVTCFINEMLIERKVHYLEICATKSNTRFE